MNPITSHWDRFSWFTVLLLPLSALFATIAAARRSLYRLGVLRPVAVARPVIVVGNISAGGTGKTPLVAWLAHRLAERGFRPLVITRGYGGTCNAISEVKPDSDPASLGDEAVLLARRTGCPVWRGADRPAVVHAALAAHPDCDCVISDDGMQHYRLARSLEIAVIDGARGFGNGLPLPAGPLREPVTRLDDVDAIVINGTARRRLPEGYAMRLAGNTIVNMVERHRSKPLRGKSGRPIHAVAGIGHPERFFGALRDAGINVIEHAFPDHHAYTPADLDFGDDIPVIMTEKDAVKCFAFAQEDWWYVPVEAVVDDGLLALVLDRLDASPGEGRRAQQHGRITG